MGACASTPPSETLPTEKPVFYYFPIAARGETVRMVAKIGGLELMDNFTDGSGTNLAEFGSPGSLPLLKHGDLKISQFPAILSYIINITPKYKTLTSPQKAKDMHINAIVMDIMDSGVPPFFGKDPDMKTKIGKALDKWYPMLEGIVPSSGFVNGLSFPTAADFAIVILKEGHTPFIGLNKLAEKDPWAACPKLTGLAERTAAVPEVKAYLAESKSLKGNPMGFPA